jgi:hypothetical protein
MIWKNLKLQHIFFLAMLASNLTSCLQVSPIVGSTHPDVGQSSSSEPLSSAESSPRSTQISQLSARSVARPCAVIKGLETSASSHELSSSYLSSIWAETEVILASKPLDNLIHTKNSQGMITVPIAKGMPIFYKVSLDQKGESPVLIAAVGPANDIQDFALFSYRSGKWKYQAYPQAEKTVALQRQNIFTGHACGGRIFEVKRKNNLMAVSFDQGLGTGLFNEVHLLTDNGGVWEIAWVPSYRDIQDVLYSKINFMPGDSLDFEITKASTVLPPELKNFKETWRLQNNTYIKN